MPGLRINIGGGGTLGNATGGAIGQAGGATIAQTAYGAGASPNSTSWHEHWHSFMGVQVGALAWLIFLRWSLPAGSKGRG